MTFRFDPCAPGASLAACETAIAACYPVPEITAAELAGLIGRAAVTVVDLRSAREQAVSIIPTALAVDESAGPGDVAAVLRDRGVADRPLVVYCAVGLRSARLVARWGHHGPPALHLRGGIFRWFREGRALAEGRTAVHPFDDRWGRLLPADR